MEPQFTYLQSGNVMAWMTKDRGHSGSSRQGTEITHLGH